MGRVKFIVRYLCNAVEYEEEKKTSVKREREKKRKREEREREGDKVSECVRATEKNILRKIK